MDDTPQDSNSMREPFAAGKQPVPDAKNIPLSQLRQRLNEIAPTQPAHTNKTCYFAARILANHGFNAHSILGGIQKGH
jgi:rhodanese-related sulfurtransferase